MQQRGQHREAGGLWSPSRRIAPSGAKASRPCARLTHRPIQPLLALASSFLSKSAIHTASTRLTRMAPEITYMTKTYTL